MSKANRTIWRTVVFAGAMLGGGCGPKPAQTQTTPTPTPSNTTSPDKPVATPTPDTTKPTTDPAAVPPQQAPADNSANADPCSGGPVTPPPDQQKPRPRTVPDRPRGRGFVLA